MINYYEILEINENASQEVIEKVYKVLIKKYHPDLQENAESKAKFEEKIKIINEAYEVLSNEQKRAEYNARLQQERTEKAQKINTQTNEDLNYQQQQELEKEIQQQAQYQQDYQNAINKAYHDAYIQDMKNRGYKIKYKKTKKDYLRSLIALLITIGLIFLICQIPFVKNYLHSLYNDNPVIRGIIDFFRNIFK